MSVELRNVVDLICLAYHEARNVRHPIREGKVVDASQYARLVSLPHNRDHAWKEMDILRSRANDSIDIIAARTVFEKFFGVSLQDLVVLYKMPIWKASAFGGNPWADISVRICALVDCFAAANWPQAEALYKEILSMTHNTGKVADKLCKLASANDRL